MGMFDIVRIKCPECGIETHLQSKAGHCLLSVYTQDAVPAEIAQDLNNLAFDCEACSTYLHLKVDSPIQTVSMHAHIWGESEEYHE
jgi:hypothetical protein